MDQYYNALVADEDTSKVPQVTLGFWIVKILATTLGETGGDAVTMSMNLGYLVGTAIFAAIFAAAVAAQMGARRFHPFLYWAVIVATTTVGTTLADFVDRSLGIGYLGGSSLLAALLMFSLAIWYRTMGTVSIASINSRQAEDSQLLISICDTGAGLPAKQADQIFNAFFTTKAQGTGMGLSISRSIVESHGGRLWAAANSPRGANFHFTLSANTQVTQ